MIEILKYVFPSLVVFVAVYAVMVRQMRYETTKQAADLRKEQSKTITPIRMRGYERLALLLDRTLPENMILQQSVPALTSIELQSKLLATIREEFDHNASQQIYVTAGTWTHIRAAKESLLQLANACAEGIDPNAPAFEYAEKIIRTYNYTPNTPTMQAMESLKREVGALFHN